MIFEPQLCDELKKYFEVKEFCCDKGHYFNREECKEQWKGRYPCPHCWPNGFLKYDKRKKPMEDLETHKLTPNMKMFFNNIFDVKSMIKNKIDEKPTDPSCLFLKELLAKLNKIYQVNQEIT